MLELSLILYLAAVLILLLSVYSKSWPSVPGRLLTAEVETEKHPEYHESASLLYEYEVEGKIYKSSLLRAAGDWGWSSNVPGLSSAQPTVEEFQWRKSLTVFYCPLFPAYACLKRGGTAMPAMLIIVATGFLVFSGIVEL